MVGPPSSGQHDRGGAMLIYIALVLLTVWALGIAGLYPEKVIHVALLVGLMFLFLGFLKRRDGIGRSSEP